MIRNVQTFFYLKRKTIMHLKVFWTFQFYVGAILTFRSYRGINDMVLLKVMWMELVFWRNFMQQLLSMRHCILFVFNLPILLDICFLLYNSHTHLGEYLHWPFVVSIRVPWAMCYLFSRSTVGRLGTLGLDDLVGCRLSSCPEYVCFALVHPWCLPHWRVLHFSSSLL